VNPLRAVYDAVHELEARCAGLRAIDQARDEYAALVADDQRAADQARADLLRLEAEEAAANAKPVADRDEWAAIPHQQRPDTPANAGPAPAPPPPPPPPPDRKAFRKQVNRFRSVWGLDAALLGRVNRIADGVDRPLGEALALLPWVAFEPGPGETADEHAARLRTWAAALAEYREFLEDEARALDGRTAGWRGIWEAWEAKATPDGQGKWTALVDGKRDALRAEAEGFRSKAAAVRERLRGRGGRT
jgi:hypothetical protein